MKLGTRTLVLATGNNLRVRGDLARRSLLIRLDSGIANPDERPFDFDPVEEVRSNRGSLVMDALTIVRAYIAAGRPSMKLKPFGSFADFDLIRGALVWLGLPDPADTRDAIKEANAEAEERFEVIALFMRGAGLSKPLTVQAIATHSQFATLRNGLCALLGLAEWNSKKVGQLLKRCRGVPMLGVAMRSEPNSGNVMQWWIEGEPKQDLLDHIDQMEAL